MCKKENAVSQLNSTPSLLFGSRTDIYQVLASGCSWSADRIRPKYVRYRSRSPSSSAPPVRILKESRLTLRIVRTGNLVHHESSQGAFCFKVTQRLTPPSNASWLFSYPTTIRQSTTTDWVANRFAWNKRLSQLRYNTSEPQVKAFRLS